MAAVAATIRSGGAAMIAASLIGAPSPAIAQTAAGTSIVNVAALRGDLAGNVASNAVTLVVAERLDCTLAPVDAATTGIVALLLTNTGTGHEAFAVTADDGTRRSVAIDSDGDGRLDAARDAPLTGGVTPMLPPGGSLRLLVPVDGGSSSLTVSVRATTGSGTPGTLLAGRGDEGSDAVIGSSGAAAQAVVALAGAPPTIVETQAVLAGDAGGAVRRGAVVAYTLVARFVAATPAASLVDPIPAGTAYLPASLTLDGDVIADAGRVADGRVVVPLGAVAAGAVHRLVFKVVIQ